MDSFVEAQNSLKRMRYRGYVTLIGGDKPRGSLLVRTCDREVSGLKTYQGPKRKEQVGTVGQSRTGFCGLTHTETVPIWGTRIE